MLCSSCHGHHWVIRHGQMMPCPECGGVGEIHCCDGLTEQLEATSSRGDYPSEAVSCPHVLEVGG